MSSSASSIATVWPDPASLAAELATFRAEASDPTGMVTAEVDGAGALVGLTLDPKAMRLASTDLAAGIVAAVAGAQENARAHMTERQQAENAKLPEPDALRAQLSEISLHAERRMNEFSSALQDVLRRVGG